MVAKKWIVGIAIVLIIAIFFAFSFLTGSSTRITVPHTGEKTDSRILGFFLNKKGELANIQYNYFGTVRTGGFQTVQYYGPDVEYKLIRHQYSDTYDRFECKRGNCDILVETDMAKPIAIPYDRDMYGHYYTKTVCFPEGTYTELLVLGEEEVQNITKHYDGWYRQDRSYIRYIIDNSYEENGTLPFRANGTRYELRKSGAGCPRS